MPSIRSRRSRARREPSSDRIEEGATQDPTQEDVEENDNASEDEQPRRGGSAQQKSSKKVKKEKTRRATQVEEEVVQGQVENGTEGAAATTANANGDNAEEVDEGAWLDLENFKNQSLSRALDAHHITNMVKDWDRFATNWQNSAMTMAPQVAEALAEVGQGKGNEKDLALKELEKLDIKMREFVNTEAEIKAHIAVLSAMCNQLALGDLSDVVDLYATDVEKQLDEWRNKTTRQKLIGTNDSTYQQFRQKIYEVQHPGEAMPPMTEFIPREEGDESDEEDLVMGGTTQNYKCPLTLLPMEKPLRSRVCKHVFSDDGIRSYFSDGKRKKCPQAGCSREQVLSDYLPDDDFARRVKAHVRREKRAAQEREEDDDDTEVIE